ncbi:MAG: hypothetical protein ACM3WV_10575 [Bacillota bacterium]
MRYYFEVLNGKPVGIVCQDETGLYFGGMVDDQFVFNKTSDVGEKIQVNLPGKGSLSVKITDPDYLEYIRLNERGSDSNSKATNVFEDPGPVEAKIEQLFTGFKG